MLGQLTLWNSWLMLVVSFSVGFEKLTRTALWESTSLKLCTDSLHFFKEVKALRTGFQKRSSSNYVPRCFRDLLVTQQALIASYLLLSCFWGMTLCEKQLWIEHFRSWNRLFILCIARSLRTQTKVPVPILQELLKEIMASPFFFFCSWTEQREDHGTFK